MGVAVGPQERKEGSEGLRETRGACRGLKSGG